MVIFTRSISHDYVKFQLNSTNCIFFIISFLLIAQSNSDTFWVKARSKPKFLVPKEKKSVKRTEIAASSSTAEHTHYKSFDPENYDDTRVRRAFLWIKVDAIKSKKKLSENFVWAKNSSRKLRKLHGGHQRHQRTFRNFFRLWVFQVVESVSEKI